MGVCVRSTTTTKTKRSKNELRKKKQCVSREQHEEDVLLSKIAESCAKKTKWITRREIHVVYWYAPFSVASPFYFFKKRLLPIMFMFFAFVAQICQVSSSITVELWQSSIRRTCRYWDTTNLIRVTAKYLSIVYTWFQVIWKRSSDQWNLFIILQSESLVKPKCNQLSRSIVHEWPISLGFDTFLGHHEHDTYHPWTRTCFQIRVNFRAPRSCYPQSSWLVPARHPYWHSLCM